MSLHFIPDLDIFYEPHFFSILDFVIFLAENSKNTITTVISNRDTIFLKARNDYSKTGNGFQNQETFIHKFLKFATCIVNQCFVECEKAGHMKSRNGYSNSTTGYSKFGDS